MKEEWALPQTDKTSLKKMQLGNISNLLTAQGVIQ